MKIHEYQGKEIFRRFDMATPRGIPAFSVDEAVKAAETLGGRLASSIRRNTLDEYACHQERIRRDAACNGGVGRRHGGVVS